MLDINLVRESPDLVRENEKRRDSDPKVVDEILKLDKTWRAAKKKVEELKHTRNVVSKEINEAKKKKDEKSASAKIKDMKHVVEGIKKGEADASAALEGRNNLLVGLGNIIHPTVPYGKDEGQNVEIKKWGKKPSGKVMNHVELCEKLDLADFEKSAETSGHGFYFLKGKLALLNQALIQFAIDFMGKKNYVYVEPPLMLRKDVLGAALDLEEMEKTIYSIEGEDLALIGTSEHALLAIHGNEALLEDEFPKKYFSYSMCFRKEVGAHGINEKGLWRTHQFNKVEQFVFCKPHESGKYFEELLINSEEILRALELPYRVIEICTGDLSPWKHQSYDVEVWRPTTGEYGEVMSLSNCTDYQTRKLGIKVVYRDGKRAVAHSLNNTALATSRIMVAILENCQTAAGRVRVPKVLWKYTGFKEI